MIGASLKRSGNHASVTSQASKGVRRTPMRRLFFTAVLASVVLVLAVASGCSIEQETAGPSELTPDDTEPVSSSPKPAPAPPPSPLPPPPPVVFKGSGARVVDLDLGRDSPLVVAASHNGTSNFVVELVPRSGGYSELLVNEIGRYSGQVAVRDAEAGRYRVQVDADGAWDLRFTQPGPEPTAQTIPGSVMGQGPSVVQIRSNRDSQPVVSLRHRGDSNFIVEVIGIGSVTGSELLANEIGDFDGETLVREMPAGFYLLAVEADGTWEVTFSQ